MGAKHPMFTQLKVTLPHACRELGFPGRERGRLNLKDVVSKRGESPKTRVALILPTPCHEQITGARMFTRLILKEELSRLPCARVQPPGCLEEPGKSCEGAHYEPRFFVLSVVRTSLTLTSTRK